MGHWSEITNLLCNNRQLTKDIDNKWTRTKTIIKCVLTKRFKTNSMQNACHKLDLAHRESLWLTGGAPERGNRKVWGSISRGGSEFLLCPTLMARRNNNYYHPSSSISRHIIVLLHSVIRMNAFDYLVKGDWRIMIVCVRVVLEASHHCKATQNRR